MKIRKHLNLKCWHMVGLFAATMMGALAGCAKWRDIPQHEPPPTKFFPANKMSPDAVALEVAVVQLDPSQEAEIEELWSLLDHQELPLERRKILDANGLRASVIPVQMPRVLRKLLKPRDIDSEKLNSFQKQMHDKGLLKPVERLVIHKKIQNRAGKSYEIPVSQLIPQQSWIIQTPEGPKAGAAESVLGFCSVRTFPSGNGSVKLKVTPQIHHGEARTKIGVIDNSFLFQNKQSVIDLDDIEMEVTLRPGESFVVGPTSDIADLGKLFFGSEGSVRTQRLLMIRLVQTQWNDLFGRRNRAKKLTSEPLN